MRIYYFGELVEDTNETKKEKKMEQTTFNFANPKPPTLKIDMESIGEILQELDLNLDSFRPMGLRRTQV